MFEGFKTKILERHIRDLMERYYWQFGLTLEEAKRLPMQELIVKLDAFLTNKKNEFEYYANVVNHLDEKVMKLTIANKEYDQRMKDTRGENKGLHSELAKLREENYMLKLENSIYKQRGLGLENNKTKSNVTELSAVKKRSKSIYLLEGNYVYISIGG
jgi:regulator of replication initiation timing